MQYEKCHDRAVAHKDNKREAKRTLDCKLIQQSANRLNSLCLANRLEGQIRRHRISAPKGTDFRDYTIVGSYLIQGVADRNIDMSDRHE